MIPWQQEIFSKHSIDDQLLATMRDRSDRKVRSQKKFKTFGGAGWAGKNRGRKGPRIVNVCGCV